MNDYKKRCLELAAQAPSMTAEDMAAANALFPAYIFRRRKTREVWTTCCHRHEVLDKNHSIFEADHTAETRPAPYCRWEAMPAHIAPPPAPCPFCGKKSPVKELGRTGRRDNLAAYRRFICFRWDGEALWAVGYTAKKIYGTEQMLTAEPVCTVQVIYKYSPGKVERAEKYSWCDEWAVYREVFTTCLRPDFRLDEPFGNCSEYGMGYDVIGLSEVDKSYLKYCQTETYHKNGTQLMRFLAVATAYPRQVEMLIKCGMIEVVKDFVFRKKRNAACFDWTEPDLLKSFGLNKNEWKQFMDTGKDMEVLGVYKRMRRNGLATIPELCELKVRLGTAWFGRLTSRMTRHKLTMTRMMNYLEKQQRRELSRGKPAKGINLYAECWCDYIDAAKYIGYDLKNDVFLLPKNLMEAHDKATGAQAALQAARRAKENNEKEKSRLKSLAKRYTYTDGRWLIRPPVNAAEIVAEGEALKHCVGGYADRHINGTTTILFLRNRKAPGKPLVTIEIRGGKIIQIHGWDDERTACKANPKRISPRIIYAEFLDGWLGWVNDGSKRDKRGSPVLREKKEEKTA